MTRVDNLVQCIIELQKEGAILEKNTPLLPGKANEDLFDLHRDNFHKEKAPKNVLALVEESLNRFDYNLRWLDLLHTPLSFTDYKNSSFNCHTPHFTRNITSSELKEWYSEILWKWYAESKDRLFLTPQIFEIVDRGAFLTNDPNATNEKHLGYDLYNVHHEISYLKSSITTIGVQNDGLTQIANQIISDNILSESIISRLFQPKKDNFSKQAFSTAFSRYLVATYYYEKDCIESVDGNNFYYLFMPYLPKISRIVTGTAICFHGKSLPPHALINELNAFNALWAQFIVRAEMRRQTAVAKYQTAISAIMSRNFSHNVGSHVLANPKLFGSLSITSAAAKNRLGTFHSYTQGRLDFMARAMSQSDDRFEPLFFVSDVLNGFFRQGVLLNTLVEDTGFPASELRFVVELPDDKGGIQSIPFEWCEKLPSDEIYKHDRDSNRFIPTKGFNDVMVGITGGQIGCHALYSFLENCLRNAVKYGADVKGLEITKEPLTLKLCLEKCKQMIDNTATNREAWILRISDNISTDPEYKISSKIRKFINTSMLDNNNEITSEGHGIQEMKVCAELLAGKNNVLQFSTDDNPCCESCHTCQEYKTYINQSKGLSTKVETQQPLRCYSVKDKDDKNDFLIYNVIIPCPVLLGLGIIDSSRCDETAQAGMPDFVKRLSLENLANTGAIFGVMLDAESFNERTARATLKEIARLHTTLPFRLMILTNSTENKTKWDNLLTDEFNTRSDGKYFIPKRRIKIIDDGQLYELLAAATPEKINIFKFLGCEGWQAIVIKIYDTWIKAYKPNHGNKPWKLCIGFDRSANQIIGTTDDPKVWYKRVSTFAPENDQSRVAIYIKANDGDPVASLNWPRNDYQKAISPSEMLNKKDELLIYDNHGKIFNTFSKKFLPETSIFYQEHGANSLNLYQSLESPPENSFGFGFFIYSLAEAALTRIAILDERVAQSTIDGNALLNAGERKLQKAGIFPLFSYKYNEDATQISSKDNTKKTDCNYLDNGFLSQTLMKASNRTICLFKSDVDKLKIYKGIFEKEGLFIDQTTSKINAAYLKGEGQPDILKNYEIDIFVIHEGVTDMLESQKRWAPNDVWKLYDNVPMVIRTSGRGSISRHLGAFLPFVEFTELSENTYRSLNKLALAKAMLGALGRAISGARS